MRDRRIGRFNIDVHIIHERPELARAVLRDVIVLRAECLDYAHCFDYVGVHPSFAVLPVGQMVPAYTADITCKGDGSVESITWKPIQ